MINSYPKTFAVGHAGAKELFFDEVLIEEKVDGSQFSFGVINGELHCRSKGKAIILDAPEAMFELGVRTAKELASQLTPNWIYRCEFLNKPKHNVLAYDRTPKKNVILFDINTGHEEYLGYDAKKAEADRLGIECVPVLGQGMFTTHESILELLSTVSCLGGQKVEGVVIKNYFRFGPDKKVLIGKYVSESFKEVHKKEWRLANPNGADFVEALCNQYRSIARWNKSIQHLRENGQIEGSPRDISKLILETQKDIKQECEDEIKSALFSWAWPKIARACIRGLPEYYKEQLLKSQFEQQEEVQA